MASAYHGGGCCFGLDVVLLLPVRAHFQMTQTLIKIIITVAPPHGSTVGPTQMKTWSKQTQCDQLFFLQASRVITVINT